MQTWLDYYIYRSLDSLTPDVRAALPKQCDTEAMLLMIGQSLHAKIDPHDNYEMTLRLLHVSMFPFLLQNDTMPGRALRLSDDLVRDLSQATPPTTDAHTMLLKSATWYIDIPHRALLVGGYQIRALFLQPAPNQSTVSIVAILTKIDSDKMCDRFAWIYHDSSAPLCNSLTDVNAEYLRQSIDDLVTLILLYRLTADSAVAEYIPHFDSGKLAQLPIDKQRARQKTHSLFRVVNLRPPVGGFGRKHTSGDGWTLDHQVPVRGHFRWQPHGPKQSFRRLQWIDAHVRGVGLDDKVDIERI